MVVFRPNRDHKLAADLQLGKQILRDIWSARADMNGVIRCTLRETKSAVAADENDLARIKLRRIRLRQILARQVDERVNMLDTDDTSTRLVGTDRLVKGSAQDSRTRSNVKDHGARLEDIRQKLEDMRMQMWSRYDHIEVDGLRLVIVGLG